MLTLTIPIAVDRATGRLVHAHEGERGRAFSCPQCRADVVWRKCDEVKRRSHFAHASDSGCGESAIHAAAKMLVAQQIGDWNGGRGLRPVITGACRHCQAQCHPRRFQIEGEPRVEFTLPSGFIPDVMVGETLAIEVLHKHPIPDEKIESFARNEIDWIEVRAEGVLDDPSEWFVERSARYVFTCSKCSASQQEVAKNALDGEAKVRAETLRLEARARELSRRYEDEARVLSASRKKAADAVNELQIRVDALKRQDESLSKVVSERQAQIVSVNAEHRTAVAARDADLKALQGDLDANRLELRKLMGGRAPDAALPDGLGKPIKLGGRVVLVIPLQRSFLPVAYGTVWFVDREDNWIYWVAEDGAFHTSRPTSLHVVTQEAPVAPVAHS